MILKQRVSPVIALKAHFPQYPFETPSSPLRDNTRAPRYHPATTKLGATDRLETPSQPLSGLRWDPPHTARAGPLPV
jgi:hypothetical protein